MSSVAEDLAREWPAGSYLPPIYDAPGSWRVVAQLPDYVSKSRPMVECGALLAEWLGGGEDENTWDAAHGWCQPLTFKDNLWQYRWQPTAIFNSTATSNSANTSVYVCWTVR